LRLAAPQEAKAVVDDELARESVAMLGTAAAMLIEDAHLQLVTVPVNRQQAVALAEALQRLGAELMSLGAAAAVLVRAE
jgi:hypothetical protein